MREVDHAKDQPCAQDQRRPLLDREADQLRRVIQRSEGTVDHGPLRGRGLRRFAGGGGADPFGFGGCALGFVFARLAGVAVSRRAFVVTFRPGCVPPAEPADFPACAGPACGGPACGFATMFGAARAGDPAECAPLPAGPRPPALRPRVPPAPTFAGVLPVALLAPAL